MNYQKIKDFDGWVKESDSGLLINTNETQQKEYLDRHKEQTDMNTMKSEILELKSLIRTILEQR